MLSLLRQESRIGSDVKSGKTDNDVGDTAFDRDCFEHKVRYCGNAY